MKIREILRVLDARLVWGEPLLEEEVATACASDMMSDVLVNPQVLRTADMLDIRCVVFVRGKQPNQEIVDLAREYDVAILSSGWTLYEASGKLYESGLKVE